MLEEDIVEELASDIYRKCGIEIHIWNCYAIAKALIKLGWVKQGKGDGVE